LKSLQEKIGEGGEGTDSASPGAISEAPSISRPDQFSESKKIKKKKKRKWLRGVVEGRAVINKSLAQARKRDSMNWTKKKSEPKNTRQKAGAGP